MNSQCDKLYLFLDGELGPVDEDNYRHHLARCGPCASGLHEAMQLELLSQQVLRGVKSPVTLVPPLEAPRVERERRRLPGWVPRGRQALGAVLALAASVATLVLFAPLLGDVSSEVWMAQAPTRLLEARVTYPRASGHRPYAPMRGGTGTASDTLPLRKLADLEAREDLHGIAAAYLVRKDWRQAEDFLRRMPPSPDRDCDQAIIALEQGRTGEALTLLEGVLRQVPTHPQALWNRALVLRELGLTLQAAEAFEAVARQGEPGWSEEALLRARALRWET